MLSTHKFFLGLFGVALGVWVHQALPFVSAAQEAIVYNLGANNCLPESQILQFTDDLVVHMRLPAEAIRCRLSLTTASTDIGLILTLTGISPLDKHDNLTLKQPGLKPLKIKGSQMQGYYNRAVALEVFSFKNDSHQVDITWETVSRNESDITSEPAVSLLVTPFVATDCGSDCYACRTSARYISNLFRCNDRNNCGDYKDENVCNLADPKVAVLSLFIIFFVVGIVIILGRCFLASMRNRTPVSSTSDDANVEMQEVANQPPPAV